MGRHIIFLAITFVQITLLAILLVSNHGNTAKQAFDRISQSQQLVQYFELTDFALWTEARYSRHPSQADIFSAFQNSPSSLDHFPAGLLIPPPLKIIGE